MRFQDASNTLGLVGEVTREAVKMAYRKLANRFHPDKNIGREADCLEVMKAINAAKLYFDLDFDWTSQKKVNPESPDNNWSEQLFDIIEKVRFYDIMVEVCGNWVWVSGDTKPIKETLKELNFKYAPKKRNWYFRPSEYKSFRSRGNWTMDEIRAVHGSEKIEKGERRKIA